MTNKLYTTILLVSFYILNAGIAFAYPIIQAEDFDSMSGIQLENANTTIGYFDNGDWLMYSDIDFGSGPEAIVFNLAKASTDGHIEVRLDALDGTLIADFYPVSTGGWTSFEEQVANITTVTGIHDLYFVARDASGVCNLDYFTFSDIGIYEPNWVLHWSDEFNGNELDESVWSKVYHGNPDNGELQFYTPRSENIEVSDGTLKLIARKETYTAQGPWMNAPETREYTSGKIETQGKLTFQYGKIEARMKLPRGKGTWPAFWMLGENLFDAGVGWPKCGEIDIMEHGQDFDNLGAAIHTESYNHTIGTQKTGTYIISDYDTDFHTYGLEWSENKLSFYVDGNHYFSLTKDAIGSSESEWPFDQPFWLILNHAVGGAWGGTPDDSLYPHTTEVDWVRVYKDIPLPVSDIDSDITGLKLYPNPVKDFCWLVWNEKSDVIKVELYTTNGQLIKTLTDTSSTRMQINTSGLANGVYLILIKTHRGIISQKLIKE